MRWMLRSVLVDKLICVNSETQVGEAALVSLSGTDKCATYECAPTV